jgi:hypothetical protein
MLDKRPEDRVVCLNGDRHPLTIGQPFRPIVLDDEACLHHANSPDRVAGTGFRLHIDEQ